MKPLKDELTERIYIFPRGCAMCKGEAPRLAQSCNPGLPASTPCRRTLIGQGPGIVSRVIAAPLIKKAGQTNTTRDNGAVFLDGVHPAARRSRSDRRRWNRCRDKRSYLLQARQHLGGHLARSYSRALMVFTNDLRLHDNPTLAAAAHASISLNCVFCDEGDRSASRFGVRGLGTHRRRFREESLADLRAGLKSLGQDLLVIRQQPVGRLAELLTKYDVDAVFYSRHAGLYERRGWGFLRSTFPEVQFECIDSHTLFSPTLLEFGSDYPATFSRFRKLAEELEPLAPCANVNALPPSFLSRTHCESGELPEPAPKAASSVEYNTQMRGGERNGLEHLRAYFATRRASNYKETRNNLDAWEDSTKFSPWLACGSLSVRTLVEALRRYEREFGSNESTYWIYFELLWREYFQWYAHQHDAKLFAFRGLGRNIKPLTSFYPERFTRWCQGNTPYPLVNACMNQLAQTGYLSNRGRQIAASCLVNELSLDWRSGAAWFERQLVDYDVASNWGNWQYIAGVGADPRGGRHFNLEKQQQIYDPQGSFVQRWASEFADTAMDSVDAADWPIARTT